MNNPRHPYPYSKMLAEKAVLAANDPSFLTTALRPHLIWGPGDPHFLPRLMVKAKAGRLWLIKSEALVDATYIDNVGQAHLLAAEKLASGSKIIGGQAYFIAQGEPLTASDMLIKLLAAISDKAEPLSVRGFLPAKLGLTAGIIMETIWKLMKFKGEPPITRFVAEELTLPHWFNLSRAKNELGYLPSVSMQEGLKRLSSAGGVEANNENVLHK